MTQNKQKVPAFNELGIVPNLLKVLEKQFSEPTPIQARVIPLAIEGKDVVGIAQTGTGKTLAFGIPMLQRLSESQGQGLILLPTRELALQVDEVLQKIGREFGLKTAILIGGASMYRQLEMIKRNPHIIVATPGRLDDHMNQKNISLNKVSIVVLDEADRMLDIGFMPQIKKILSQAPQERQTLLFSATMPHAIAQIATTFMKTPLRVEVAPPGLPAANIDQKAFVASKDNKMQLLEKLLEDHPGSVLVFSRTKYGAKKIMHEVRAMGYTAAEMHSNLSLGQRKEALSGFKSGAYRILIATDIAARGIDVNNISLVINFDLPDNPEDYVHRIGRTGRAGKSGKAISFIAPTELYDVRHIERLIKVKIPIHDLPTLPKRRPPVVEAVSVSPRGGYGRSGGSREGYGRSSSPRAGGYNRSSGRSRRPGDFPRRKRR